MRLFLSPPHMSGKELEYIQEAFESNYIAPVGPFLERFEKSVAEFVQAPATLALCSGTAGLHLALRLLDMGPNDKVAVSDFTFIASLSPILYQGASPILVGCDESWQMDPNALEEALQKERPKAVILTHIYGQSADVATIKELCDHYGAQLVEDAAESLGATFDGRHTGTFGTLGVYSFNGNKLLTTGGGGVLVGSKELIEKARFLATQAREPGVEWYEHKTYGYNYRLSNVAAAIGTAQMEVIEERIAKKRQIFEWYREFLGDKARFMPELLKSFGNRWLTTALFHTDPLHILQELKNEGIESRPLWKPMHMQPLCKDFAYFGQKKEEELFAKGLCLPSGTAMAKEDVKMVCEVIDRCHG